MVCDEIIVRYYYEYTRTILGLWPKVCWYWKGMVISMVFTTVEKFWGEDLTADISYDEAYAKIREQIICLNPNAKEKDIKKFIL